MIGDRMVNELRAVAAELGGERVLGRTLRTETDLQAAIREGFPQKVLKEVAQSAGITLGELAASLDLSARSLQRRRKEGRLARFESDRVYRLLRGVVRGQTTSGGEWAGAPACKR